MDRIATTFHTALIDHESTLGVLVMPKESDDVCRPDGSSIHGHDLDLLKRHLSAIGYCVERYQYADDLVDHQSDGLRVARTEDGRALVSLVPAADAAKDWYWERATEPSLFSHLITAAQTVPVPDPPPTPDWRDYTDLSWLPSYDQRPLPEWAAHLHWIAADRGDGARCDYAGRVVSAAGGMGDYFAHVEVIDPGSVAATGSVTSEWSTLREAMVEAGRMLPPRDPKPPVRPVINPGNDWVPVHQLCAELESMQQDDLPVPRTIHGIRLSGIDLPQHVESLGQLRAALLSVPSHWMVSRTLLGDRTDRDLRAVHDDAVDVLVRIDTWSIKDLLWHLQDQYDVEQVKWITLSSRLALELPSVFNRGEMLSSKRIAEGLEAMSERGYDNGQLHRSLTAAYYDDLRTHLGWDTPPERARWRLDIFAKGLVACAYFETEESANDACIDWMDRVVHIEKEQQLAEALFGDFLAKHDLVDSD